jgi:hypothetical protein
VGVENRRRWTLPFVLVQAAGAIAAKGVVAALAISEPPPYRGQRQSFQGPAKMRAAIGGLLEKFF